MNVQVEGTDLEQEDQIPAPAEQTEDERQAEADMLAGFAGKTDEPKEEVKDEPKDETPAEVKTEPAPKEPTLSDVMAALQALDGRQRKIEGKFGEVNGSVKALQEAAQATRAATTQGQDAPTEKQVAAAASAAATGDFKKLDALVADFPDVGEALIELRDHFANVTKQIPKVDEDAIAEKAAQRAAERAGATSKELVAQARALARIDLAHDGWEETVNTPEFGKWLDAQPAETQALASSDKPKDSIKLLDSYKAHRTAVAAEAERQKSKTRRLESALPVRSTGAAGGPQVLDDEAAFLEGFKTG